MFKTILVTFLFLFSNLVYSKQKDISLIHYNVDENKIVHDENIHELRPIASLTKLMTAMVALDYDKTLNRELKLINKVGSSLPYKTYTRKELFEAMLIRSDNAAAETIANDFPGGRKMFILKMNSKAEQIGLKNTSFKDPTGLNRNNISTASEVASMVISASKYELIKSVSIKKQAAFDTTHKKKPRTIYLNNTNRTILFEFDNVVMSKTGFTIPAGFCVAMMVEKKTDVIQNHVIVVMGTKNPKERIDVVKNIMYKEVLPNETRI